MLDPNKQNARMSTIIHHTRPGISPILSFFSGMVVSRLSDPTDNPRWFHDIPPTLSEYSLGYRCHRTHNCCRLSDYNEEALPFSSASYLCLRADPVFFCTCLSLPGISVMAMQNEFNQSGSFTFISIRKLQLTSFSESVK